MSYSKQNIEAQLHRAYDRRRVHQEMIDFYKKKVDDSLDVAYIWRGFLEKQKEELQKEDVEIQYLQYLQKSTDNQE